MLTPKVSVIIPCYNSEAFIEKCLDSVCSQILDGIEIIACDDGSTDHTFDILKEYSERYTNFKLLKNKSNMGAGYTKNHAVSVATGKYIGFVDSDDYIDKDYFSKLFKAAEKFEADIACAEFALIYPDREIFCDYRDSNRYLITENVTSPLSDIPIPISGKFVAGHWSYVSACTKIFRNELITRYPFHEGICDDIAAVLPMIAIAKKIVYVPDLYYYYVQRRGSLEGSGFSKERVFLNKTINSTITKLQEIDGSDIYMKLLYSNSVCYTIVKVSNEFDKKDILKEFLYDLNDKYLLNPYHNKYLYSLLCLYGVIDLFYYIELFDLISKNEIEMAIIHIEKWSKNKSEYLPKVSIVIPVYNGSNYMKVAIESALNQTYANIEVLVINDGSTDDGETERIALSYGNRIRYYKKENGRVASALNYGINRMQGTYFSWLSHDDYYDPKKIEAQMRILNELEDKTTLITGGYRVVDETGNIKYDNNPLMIHTKQQLEKPLFAVMRGCIHGCSILIHKSHFDRVGVFREDLPTTQDYEFFFRLMQGQAVFFQEDLHVYSRSHDEQDSKKYYDSHMDECNNLWIGFMKKISDDEKTSIDGSKYLFYKNTYAFLKNETPYESAVCYVERNMIRAFSEERRSSSNQYSEYILQEAQYLAGSVSDSNIALLSAELQIVQFNLITFLLSELNRDKKLNIQTQEAPHNSESTPRQRRLFKSFCVRAAKGYFRVVKRILTALHLKSLLKSTPVYKKMLDNGILERLNG